MKHLRNALIAALLLAWISPAFAQLPNIQDRAVWGRIGNAAADGGSGPSQAVPFPTLFAAAGIPSGPQTCSTSNWFNTLSAAGVLGCAQPSFSDLTGSLPNSQMAAMAANTTKCNATGGSAVPTDCTGSTMRTNLALVIGTNVEAWDTDLDCLAAISTTGTIKRTGSGTCSAGSVALSDLATGSQDTVIGYWGSTTASALAVNNCTGALTYSTSTHTFGCNAAAGTGTVTSVTCGTGLSGGTFTTTGTCAVNQTVVTNSLGSITAIANGSYTDGPSTAQGTSGGWWAGGTVTIGDTVANIGACKLWDGTTVISSTNFRMPATAAAGIAITLSGFILSPAANIRISCTSNDATATFRVNDSGVSKDSTLTVHRIQ